MRTLSRLVIVVTVAVTTIACGLSRPDDTLRATPAQVSALSGEASISTKPVPSNATAPNAAPTVRGQGPAGTPTATGPDPAVDGASVGQPDGAQGTSTPQGAAKATASAVTQKSGTASALTDEQRQVLAGLEPRGAAPEVDNEVWLNSEPLRLADLRGQVVLLEFWTFG